MSRDDSKKDDQAGNQSDKPVVWDDFFINPTDDLVTVSNDGVHFRAPSFRLARSSSMFNDMLQLPLDTNPSHNSALTFGAMSSKPIELDYSAFIVRKFLWQACRPPYELPRGDHEAIFAQALKRIDSIDHFGAPYKFLSDAWTDLASIAKRKMCAFDILVMASDRNNVSLGQLTMMSIGPDEVRELYNSSDRLKAQLERLQPSWAASLRRKIYVDASVDTVLAEIEELGWRRWGFDFVSGVQEIEAQQQHLKRKGPSSEVVEKFQVRQALPSSGSSTITSNPGGIGISSLGQSARGTVALRPSRTASVPERVGPPDDRQSKRRKLSSGLSSLDRLLSSLRSPR